MFFFKHPDFEDDTLTLYPIHITPADRKLGFGREQVWRITLKNQRKEIGQISFRNGESQGIYYYGHIGYHIDPSWRGHGYAGRACRLIRSEILREGKNSVIITCDPDNVASKKTCQHLGCLLEGEVSVPKTLQKQFDISDRKLRFIWMLTSENGA